MNALIVLPLIIPLTAAALSLLAWREVRLQRWLAVVGTAALLVAGIALWIGVYRDGIQVTFVGGWPAPYGIVLVADLLSATMVLVTGVIGLAGAVYSLADIDRDRESFGYYPLLHMLLMGVCGAFLTGDLFNLYVWFEVMLMASFVLLALGGEPAQVRGALVYVTLNLLTSAIFLAAVGIVYGTTGTLNLADLAVKLNDDATPAGLNNLLAMFFLVAFGIKAAAFPLFFWLPASYHTPPVVVSAVFAGLLTKVGVYTLIRFFTLLFIHDTLFTHGLILVVAGLTMVAGVLGAAAQSEFRRILSFHIISQIGYMLMGLGLFGLVTGAELKVLCLAGSIFYIVHHILVKTNLFLVSGLVHRLRGTYELKQLGGLYRSRPFLAMLFAVPALSLAGIPPLSGFFAKLALVRAGLEAQQYAIVATALVVSLLTIFSMTKIWAEAFWKAAPGDVAGDDTEGSLVAAQPLPPLPRTMVWPAALLAAMTVAIGLSAGPLFDVSIKAAEQLVDREAYLNAVLGGKP